MEYRAFYKNASRGQNRLKDNNSQAVRSKRESSRQDLHFTNRNLNTSDYENDENVDDAPLFRKIVVPPSSQGKKRRRSHRAEQEDEDKENVMRTKYEERLARLRKYKEEKAKSKANSAKKKKPFVSVVPKNNLVDREYEKNLFKKSDQELKKMAEKRKLLTPAAKHATPRVDTRRREEPASNNPQTQARRNILNVKTPASVKLAQSKVDTWRKGSTPSNQVKLTKINTATVTKTRTATKTTATKTTTGRNKLPVAPSAMATTAATAAVSSKKGATAKIIAGGTGFTTYQKVRSGQKSTKFNFKFANDGQMVTSTNRKKKSLEKMFRANAPQHLQIPHFSPKAHPPVAAMDGDADDDDIFEGISPIDVDTPTPKKKVLDSDQLAIVKREIRRRSMVFQVEDVPVKQEIKTEAAVDAWEPQVITISDDSDCSPQMNGSFTVEVKKEGIDRRPTITDSPRLVGSGRKSLTGRPSLIFVEQDNVPGVVEVIQNPDATQILFRQDTSLVFIEEDQHPEEEQVKEVTPLTIEVFDSPKRVVMAGSPSRRLSGTPRMSFVEEDVQPASKPLPEGNLATLLLNKQEGKRRSSGGSRRSSLNSFREEDQPPSDVKEKVVFYYNLVDKELKRLQELCDLYKDDAEDETIEENSKGLIIAAQGQTNILINKKLSKFKELVGHYERNWADQKVRTDDLDGFWLMVSLDLENLDRRFEELRLLKDNNWKEVAEQPKVKKIAGGGGIKKRDKKPMKTKASGLADLIKKAREEAKRKKMMEVALTETVTVVTPVKRSVRIATTPRRSSLARNSICTGCTPTALVPSGGKKSRKTIFNDHTLRRQEIVKSILKTPSEKRRAKSVLFLDSGLDTPPVRHSNGGCGGRKIVHTPKPKITFNEELEVEDVETISLTTPYKLDEEIRKRRRSSLFVPVPATEEEEQKGCCSGTSRRKTLRFDAPEEQDEAQDQITSPVAFEQGRKEKSKRTTRGKSRGKVSFL